MMIQLLQEDPGQYFAIVIVVIVSIVLHELAHGITAIKFGDRTPIETGHMTLNPLVHMGGLSLILLAVAGFAWGQMPVNPSRMRGKYADFWVSFAGPIMNVILAVLGVVGLGLLNAYADGESRLVINAKLLLFYLGLMNFALAILNLIPVPPLDGSHMLANVSRGYRNLITGDTGRGFATAALFAVFLGAGTFIFSTSARVMGFLLHQMEKITG